MDREDITTPHKCDAAYIWYGTGVDLADIEPFTAELTTIVDTMKEELANEIRILEGTAEPEYNPSFSENELSNEEQIEPQWRSVSLNGYWTTGLTPTSTNEFVNSSSTANICNPNCPTLVSNDRLCPSYSNCCSGSLEDCGNAIDASNESCVCTVPTISEQTLGTQNEEK